MKVSSAYSVKLKAPLWNHPYVFDYQIVSPFFITTGTMLWTKVAEIPMTKFILNVYEI